MPPRRAPTRPARRPATATTARRRPPPRHCQRHPRRPRRWRSPPPPPPLPPPLPPASPRPPPARLRRPRRRGPPWRPHRRTRAPSTPPTPPPDLFAGRHGRPLRSLEHPAFDPYRRSDPPASLPDVPERALCLLLLPLRPPPRVSLVFVSRTCASAGRCRRANARTMSP